MAQPTYDGTKEFPEDLCFYIFMRDDMESLNDGKAIAQGAHAANDMNFLAERDTHGDLGAMYQQWRIQSKQSTFGTTITLAVDGRILPDLIAFLQDANIPANSVRDDTYPVTDGKVTHLIDIITCGWAMGSRAALKPLLSQFNLFP